MKINHVFLIALVFCLLSCSTGRTIVSDSVNLRKYQYASLVDVMDNKGYAALMDMEVQIYDAVESTGLKMIGDRRIDELSPEQKEQLLLVRFSASQSEEESIISVNFVDYMTGKPVASCRGTFGFIWEQSNSDMYAALSKVTKEIKKLFQAN